jgi:16S rRNA (guanine527-N7)-methyltransferase
VSAAARARIDQLRQPLQDGIAALGIDVPEHAPERLLQYLDLLLTWNSAYNLSGITDPREMLHRHILDSLSVLPAVHGKRVIDIGTGAGLPGIPLAVCLPGTEFHLLDSNGKKMRFLFQVKSQLHLDNVVLIHGRAEDCPEDILFDIVLSRAVASLEDLLSIGGRLLAPEGEMLAMKSAPSAEELAGVKPPYTVRSITGLTVPGATTPRHLVSIARTPGQDGNTA